MNDRLRSYGVIADIYLDKSDPVSVMLWKITKVVFAISFVALALGMLIFGPTVPSGNAFAFLLLVIYGAGFLIGFLILVPMLGIRSFQKSRKLPNFLLAIAHVFYKVFLYILLPCIVFTLLVLGWAYITDQPIFNK